MLDCPYFADILLRRRRRKRERAKRIVVLFAFRSTRSEGGRGDGGDVAGFVRTETKCLTVVEDWNRITCDLSRIARKINRPRDGERADRDEFVNTTTPQKAKNLRTMTKTYVYNFFPYFDAMVITFQEAKTPKTEILHWRSAKITAFTDVHGTVHKNVLKWIFENSDKIVCRVYDAVSAVEFHT